MQQFRHRTSEMRQLGATPVAAMTSNGQPRVSRRAGDAHRCRRPTSLMKTILTTLLGLVFISAFAGTAHTSHAQSEPAPSGMSGSASFATDLTQPDLTQPDIDLSGIQAFWHVADILAAGQDPVASDWDRMFDSPGYEMLADRYPLKYPIRMSMKLTFDPRRAEERRDVESSTVWMRPRMIRHLKRVNAQREALHAFHEQLTVDDSLITDAMRILRPHLPPGAMEARYPPLVSFVIFLDDGYASPDVVAIDLLMAKSIGRASLTRFIAHELFHAYRSAIALPTDQRGSGYMAMLVGALEQLENEGIADQIDKPELLAAHPESGTLLGDYADDYRTEYSEAPTDIAAIGRLLARIEQRRRFSPNLVRQVQRTIPMGGHPTGAYMADVIAEQNGRTALHASVGNVFAFFRAYQDAAGQDPRAPVFPDAAMYLIERLETLTAVP